jgi:hypothetical protein
MATAEEKAAAKAAAADKAKTQDDDASSTAAGDGSPGAAAVVIVDSGGATATTSFDGDGGVVTEVEVTEQADPKVRRGECVVKADFHVGRAVNGKVCSYHAMSHDADGNPRATK